MYVYLYCSARTKQIAHDASPSVVLCVAARIFSITASPYLHSSPICALHPHIRISAYHVRSRYFIRRLVMSRVLSNQFSSSLQKYMHRNACLIFIGPRTLSHANGVAYYTQMTGAISPHYVHPASRFPHPRVLQLYPLPSCPSSITLLKRWHRFYLSTQCFAVPTSVIAMKGGWST